MPKTLDEIFADLPGAIAPADTAAPPRAAGPRSVDEIFADLPQRELRNGETRVGPDGVTMIGVTGMGPEPEPAAPPVRAAGGGSRGLEALKRQGGLSLRAPVEAAAGLAGIVGDPLAALYNLATGRNVDLPSTVYQRKIDEYFPKPQTPVEQFANKFAGAGYQAMLPMAAAKALPAGPVVASNGNWIPTASEAAAGVRNGLSVNPVGQVAGAASGAGAAEIARQEGLPWWAQLSSSLIAAPLGGMVGNRVANNVEGYLNMRDAVMQAGPGATRQSVIDQAAQRIAGQSGAQWEDLTQTVRNSLRQQVEESIRTGTPIDPVRAQRMIAFQRLGAQPTNAMLTRNPQDWAREDMLRKFPGDVGAPLNQAHEAVGGRVRDALSTMPEIGDQAAGREIAGGLQAVRGQLAADRTAAYTAARNSPEGMQGVPIEDFRRFLNSRQTLAGTQPQYRSALAELERLAEDRPAMTQNNWEELRKTINAMRNPADASSVNATNEIRAAMDEAFGASGKSPAFAEARFRQSLYKATTADQRIVGDLTDMLSNVDRKVPYSKVFDRLIQADPNQLKQVKNTLTTGGQADRWEAMKARTFQELADTLNQGATTENRGGMFLRKMDNLSEQLPIIFDPAELKQLQAARQVVELAMTAPRGTVSLSNPSGTAGSLMNYASAVLRNTGNLAGPIGNRLTFNFGGAVKSGAQAFSAGREVDRAMQPSMLTQGLLAGQPVPTGQFLTPALLSLVYGGGLRAPAEGQ